MVVGRWIRPLEAAAGALWSVGEVATCLARPEHFEPDPHRDAVLRDIADRGFYPALTEEELRLSIRGDGLVRGANPYRRASGRPTGEVLAHLRRHPGSRTLVVVCHCYGMPFPALMRALFGVDELPVDVCTNIMSHHQPGTYPLWPGSGFTSARLSELVENLREAITGVRALVEWLTRRRGYDRVVVLGFSIGGHLALHLANSTDVDAVLAYAPMTNLYASVTELGIMDRLHGPVERTMRKRNPHFDLRDLAITDPMAYPLRIDERALHVVVQRHDVMARPSQIAAIRRAHPAVGWYELPGTHVFPAGLGQLHGIVRSLVQPPELSGARPQSQA